MVSYTSLTICCNHQLHTGGDDNGRKRAIYEILSEDGLGQFEMKRQRAFRIFYELTSANRKYNQQQQAASADRREQGGGESISNAEATRFYPADMRPSIPEFFDFGEVPLLEGIFQSHPDISHVVHLAGELEDFATAPMTELRGIIPSVPAVYI